MEKLFHMWKGNHRQVLPVYLLENGNLLRSTSGFMGRVSFLTGGFTGRVEMLSWEGELIWEYSYSSRNLCLHNDIEPLPNGNILMSVWEYKTRDECIAAGVDPNTLKSTRGLLTDFIIEVEPVYPDKGNIVWEWHAWDHLIQDYDSSKDNYGVIADHPGLIDINYDGRVIYSSVLADIFFPFSISDLLHINSIDYNRELDQILIGCRQLDEIFIIDHNTTMEEAAAHTGGHYGKGGDLLYRWGNPQNYDAGDKNDQKLFCPHDPRWIEPGCPGEGNIIIFNNGYDRQDGNYSSIEEIVLPVDSEGNYLLTPGENFGPEDSVWNYSSKNKKDFFSEGLSSVQRLPNGNTLICSGVQGIFFEINPENMIVWKYYNIFPLPFHHLNNVFKITKYSPDYPGLAKLK